MSAILLELELALIQSHMAQKPMLRGEVGCACVACEVIALTSDSDVEFRFGCIRGIKKRASYYPQIYFPISLD